jgi:hypothetical protein
MITACGTPAVVWQHVHDEKCDYGIHLKDDFSPAIKADPDETDAKRKFSEWLVSLPIATLVQINYR